MTPKPSVRDSLRLLRRLPLLRQLEGDPLALGKATRSGHSERLVPRTATADKVVDSICPYCAVGCGQKVYVKDEQVIQVEGDPTSPISRGRLCPKATAEGVVMDAFHCCGASFQAVRRAFRRFVVYTE